MFREKPVFNYALSYQPGLVFTPRSVIRSSGCVKFCLWLVLSSFILSGLVYADSESTPLLPQYDLRVYGPLKTEDKTPANAYYRQIRITSQSHEKAELLVSKFLRDFTTLPPVMIENVSMGKETIPALSFEGGRRILPVLQEGSATVDFYLFSTPMDLTHFVSSTPAAVADAVAVEGRKYPYFLDFWDRHCMGSWYAPRNEWDGKYFTEEGNSAFMKRYALNMNLGGSFLTGAAEADRHGIGYKFNRWLDVSVSAYDANPEAATTGDPDVSFLNSYYGDVPFADNPVGFGQMDEMTAFYKQFTDDEYLTSITDPHGETGPEVDAYYGATQRGEYSRKDLVHYLRDLRKYSLGDLGTRWYGNTDKYKSWDDVAFPREREYYGWSDGQSQDLAGTWKLKSGTVAEGESGGYAQENYDDSKWFTFQAPGTTYIDLTHRQGNPGGWNRFSFAADDALLKSGKTVYLTICPFNDARFSYPDVVYLNGKKLGEITFGYGLEWAQFDVSSALKPGANLLAVHSTFGVMRGPVFLTLKKVEKYPTSDPTLNARWYDIHEWVADDVARGNARDITFLRGADPERPVKIMAYDSMIDVMNPYTQALGGCPHCTGESAFFRPWFKRYGYLRGINDSSEPSQPAKNIDEIKSLFFCMTMEGMNAHDYFINLTNILRDPLQKAWYEKNLPYFELMGAFDLKKPDIVIARSLRALRTLPLDVAEENDIGRGDIQQAHFSYVYTSEREIADGLINNYKILIDDNFHALNPEDVDHLQAWVEAGGALVLNQRSGRDSYLQGNNTWPIAKLLGCTPTIRPQTGTVKFEDNPVILKAYAGKSFNNAGESIDWQKYNYFADSIALDATASDVSIVARYDDGKPAIIVRTVGKGRVVVLGSAFYRKTSDDHGYYNGSPDEIAFYDHLFTDLEAAPVVESSSDKLWSERFISNNGSTEMLILGNQSGTTPLQSASATWDLGFHPRRVFDPANGSDLDYRIDGNKVVIDKLDLEPHEMRYLAVERSDWGADETVKHWLARQSDLWHAITIPAATPPVEPLHAISFPGLFSVKQFTDEAEARKALAPGLEVDGSWRSMRWADWAVSGLSGGPNVVTVYRKNFTVTPEWLKGARGVQILANGGPFGPLEIAINGTRVSGDGSAEVTPEESLAALKPGANLITLLAKAGGTGNGGSSHIFALRRLPAGEFVDISNDWTGYLSDDDSAKVDFPAEGEWTMVRKTLTLTDAQRAATSLWIEVDGSVAAVSVNGHVLYNSAGYGALYPAGNRYRVNVSSVIKRDGPNEIGIGGGNWINGQFLPSHLHVNSVKLLLVPSE